MAENSRSGRTRRLAAASLGLILLLAPLGASQDRPLPTLDVGPGLSQLSLPLGGR